MSPLIAVGKCAKRSKRIAEMLCRPFSPEPQDVPLAATTRGSRTLDANSLHCLVHGAAPRGNSRRGLSYDRRSALAYRYTRHCRTHGSMAPSAFSAGSFLEGL